MGENFSESAKFLTNWYKKKRKIEIESENEEENENESNNLSIQEKDL